ncbi:MAG: Gfo/Idh/MocA family oxidoreductase [Acidobacteriota bacterium]
MIPGTPLRTAVVGARSRRQGTGEYVARELARAGCLVTAVVGTSEETLREARERLAARYGIECRGYLRLADLLAAEEVDAVVVCSPPEHHLEALELALAAGCHAFCEKPLWWEDGLEETPAAAVEARAAALVRGFAERGLVLAVNTQMPFTLEGFDRLYPGARAEPPRSFAMRMSPITAGPRAVVDSAPHLLSMLYALAGEGSIEDAAAFRQDADGGRQTLGFVYRHDRGAVRTRLVLRRRLSAPRPLSYCVDGNFATRRIEMPDYRIRLADRRRSVALRDPLSGSVDRFVEAVRSGRAGPSWELAAGMLHLHQLVAARSDHGRQAG